jgi:hypothetical protein
MKTLLSSNQKKVIANQEMLPREAYLGNKFSFISHCSMGGGVFKAYEFEIISPMVSYLLNARSLFKYYSFDGIDKLENPALYSENKLILSVCTHEHTAALHLTDEQYNDFKKIGIPYSY